MKTAVIYYSKHGTTGKVASLIGESLSSDTELVSLKEYFNPDIQAYDRIILGTPIYAGHSGRLMRDFCNKNRAFLEQKVIGLFICCMNREHEEEEMKNAYPEYLHQTAIAKAVLGGEFLFNKMNFIECFFTKRIAKIKSSVSDLRYDTIQEFAKKMNDCKNQEEAPAKHVKLKDI